MMPAEITVGLPEPPWLQVMKAENRPSHVKQAWGFSTILPAATYPVLLLVALPKALFSWPGCLSHICSYEPFLCFKSCFLSHLFQQVSSDTPNVNSPFLFFISGELCMLLNSHHHSLLCKSCGCVSNLYLEVLRGRIHVIFILVW